MWVYVIIVWLILGAGYWIIKPLLQANGHLNAYTSNPEDVLERLNYKKEGVYAAIRELEFDLNMGKLSEEDFQILKQQYMQEAAGYLKEMDEIKSLQAKATKLSDEDIEEEIEQEVTSIRLQKSTSEKYVYCTLCGEKASVEDNFCGGCGSALKKGRGNPASHSEDVGKETIEKC